MAGFRKITTAHGCGTVLRMNGEKAMDAPVEGLRLG